MLKYYIKIRNATMWVFLCLLYLNFGKNIADNSNIASSIHIKETKDFNCNNGKLLSSSVCIPYGYLQGEVPKAPTVVKTKIEINNIREVDDKRMRLTLDFYQELKWADNRIRTNLPVNGTSVLNNNLIKHIWKPDLWIKNIFDFKLHSVIEPTAGLIIMETEVCKNSEICNEQTTQRHTIVTYNLEAQTVIYCNFHFVNFPMDTQHCEFIMDGSYPYPDIVYFSFELGAFGVTNKNSNTDAFAIDITFNETRTTNQSGIQSTIKLERSLLPFVIKYYLPCVAIIIVSLIGFLISIASIPARVALLVTQFLTLTNVLIAQQVKILPERKCLYV